MEFNEIEVKAMGETIFQFCYLINIFAPQHDGCDRKTESICL